MWQIFTKTHLYIEIVGLNRSLFSKYTTNLKTKISQRKLILILVCSNYNFISFILFLIDIINNIIYKSVLRQQNSNQWEIRKVVTCLCLYPVTSILHRNIRYNFDGSRSRAKVICFQYIPPFIFPLQYPSGV